MQRQHTHSPGREFSAADILACACDKLHGDSMFKHDSTRVCLIWLHPHSHLHSLSFLMIMTTNSPSLSAAITFGGHGTCLACFGNLFYCQTIHSRHIDSYNTELKNYSPLPPGNVKSNEDGFFFFFFVITMFNK